MLKYLVIFMFLAFGPEKKVANEGVAFEVFGQAVTMKSVEEKNQAAIYEIKKGLHDLIKGKAEEAYMKALWERKAKGTKLQPLQVRQNYMEKHAKVDPKEATALLNQHKNNPQLQKLSEAERKQQVMRYLQARKIQEVTNELLAKGRKAGDLKVYQKPKEPLYDVVLGKDEHFRYGPKVTDTKPLPGGCRGDKCVTIVEVSEFQCPYCARVAPVTKQLLKEYAGKIRLTVMDFPLSFHKDAEYAAIVARCAGKQDKYWEMYTHLFDNQRELGADKMRGYAKSVKLDLGKFDVCVKDPAVKQRVKANMEQAMSLGVSGTPAFFVDKRRRSGVLSYSAFKDLIEEALENKKSLAAKKKVKSNG